MVLTIRKKSSVLTNLYDFCVKGFSFETLDFFFIIAVIMIEWRRVKVLKTDNIKKRRLYLEKYTEYEIIGH